MVADGDGSFCRLAVADSLDGRAPRRIRGVDVALEHPIARPPADLPHRLQVDATLNQHPRRARVPQAVERDAAAAAGPPFDDVLPRDLVQAPLDEVPPELPQYRTFAVLSSLLGGVVGLVPGGHVGACVFFRVVAIAMWSVNPLYS